MTRPTTSSRASCAAPRDAIAAMQVAVAAVDEAERAAVEAIVARMDADAVQALAAATRCGMPIRLLTRPRVPLETVSLTEMVGQDVGGVGDLAAAVLSVARFRKF